MGTFPDIDMDFADRDRALRDLDYVSATLVDDQGKRQRHTTGVYFQNVPVDPVDEWCVYNHKVAGDYGYFKFDFLNLALYKDIRNEAHLDALLRAPVMWELFEDREIVGVLYQIKEHFDLIHTIKPKSIIDLAVCIALMRPGKTHLIKQPRSVIDAQIWLPSDKDKYSFKKSHAVAYATGIVVQLNLMIEKAQAETGHDIVGATI